MADNSVTLVGNVTSEPELRFSAKGQPIANFSIGVSHRVKKGDEWTDQLDGFFKCSVFGAMAENVAESLHKGMRVVVTGRLHQSSWTDGGSGARRTAVEIQVDEVGPSLKFATVEVHKVEREREMAG